MPLTSSFGNRGSSLGNGMYEKLKALQVTFAINCSQLVKMVSEPEE